MANGTNDSVAGLSTTSDELWYCHSCQKHVVPNLTEYCCSLCESGCIEDVKNATPAENDAPEPMEAYDLPTVAPLTQFSRLPDMEGLTYGEAAGPVGRGSIGVRSTSRVMRRPARRTHIAIHRVSNNGAPGNSFQAFINQFMQGLMGNGGALTGGALNIQVQPLLLTANAGDYVWTQGGLDNIITLLMNQLDGSGPPPADKTVIDSLPTITIDQHLVDGHVQCHVCMEDYELNEQVRRLPCKHLFHSDCITPWLELHGTCPICRQALDSQSTAAVGTASLQTPPDDSHSTSSTGSENPDSYL